MYWYVYLFTENYVFITIWCKGLHGKETTMKLWRRLRLGFPLEALGTKSWCLFLILCFWFFMICCAWLWLCLCLVQGLSILLWCHVFIGFHGHILVCFLSCISYFESWELVWERGILVELSESCVEPNR